MLTKPEKGDCSLGTLTHSSSLSKKPAPPPLPSPFRLVINEADMMLYIQQYFEKECVSLNRKNIVKNPGIRALANLCLNSFGGKFDQRLSMRKTEFFHEMGATLFFQLLSDPIK